MIDSINADLNIFSPMRLENLDARARCSQGNPKSWNLETGIRNPESGIRNPKIKQNKVLQIHKSQVVHFSHAKVKRSIKNGFKQYQIQHSYSLYSNIQIQ